MKTLLYKKINLTTEQLNAISKEARSRKFNVKDLDLIYPTTNSDYIIYFCQCYDFLGILIDNLEQDNFKIIRKVKEFRVQFKELYNQSLKLKNLITFTTSDLSKVIISKKINKFVIENLDEIKIMLNEVFPVGRMVYQYDPNEVVGQY